MLPLQQSYEIKYALSEYLKATFRMNSNEVNAAFQDFILGKDGMFKGPYLSARLPFREASTEEVNLEIKPPFPPYHHQYKAFERLSSRTEQGPQPTLITTGTASGKTECFLYPVLDYCYRERDRRGVKVVILYPMNALATDQAKRLAEAIWNDERLRGVITAGLFIGEGKEVNKFPTDMGSEHIIENRTAIVNNPPDILLTNFKMLDYGLMRHTFHNLWSYNLKDPGLLKFIVLDELHTYDGAQGTDVANLIRRLKLKLGLEKGTIVPVGTSATIGSGADSKRLLAEYASKVFGEDFSESSIIEENRLRVEDYFASEREMYDFLPSIANLQSGRMGADETYEGYIERQKKIWRLQHCQNAVELGAELKQLQIVRQIVEVMNDQPVELSLAIKRLCDRNERFREMPETEGEGELQFSPREELLNSIWALMAEARRGSSRLFPFVYLQAQLWIRELSGVLRVISNEPKFVWRDRDEFRDDEPLALPPYFCRECGASGWLGVKQDNNNTGLEIEPSVVYEKFFQNDKNIYYLNYAAIEYSDEYKPADEIIKWIEPQTLRFARESDVNSVKLKGSRRLSEKHRSIICCPECNGTQVAIIGTKIPTLSSISVSQLLSSDLDPRSERERKTLAFTNSVQDAAHQAGFIEARNYRFTLRTSLQQVINHYKDKQLDLAALIDAFHDYWKQKSREDFGTEMAYYHRFFPEDVKASIDDYMTSTGLSNLFKKEFETRVSWEIVSEFGLNATIGRTLEKTGASACSFSSAAIEKVADEMRSWLESNNLGQIGHDELCRFINLFLHRIRIRGGVSHEYLEKARTTRMERWDLNWNKDNRHFLNRYFGKSSRLPKMIGSGRANFLMDSTTIPGNNITWFKAYYLKSFVLVKDYNEEINDFYKTLLSHLSSILDCRNSNELENYAISPTAMIIGKNVCIYRCSVCAGKVTVLDDDRFVEGASCLSFRCKGKYELSPVRELTYYKQVYNRNRAPRIYATEHTGLLERKDREGKEIDFKTRPKDDSLNVLVATSTLEMGIDIGTLNSVMNNSVPPLTGNFLQRVGRAGRSTGSALVVNFAKTQSHDLFYFVDPMEMMCGKIHTPGCFLEAKDILFRHFFAFCIDTWTMSDPSKNVIIPQVRILGIRTRDLDDPSLIYNRWIAYIRKNRKELLTRFIELYQQELGDSPVLMELSDEINSGRFFGNLRFAFERLKNEYESLSEKIKDVNLQLSESGLPESSDQYKEIVREKRTLGGLRRLIDKRSILEYLTNSGLLPNYAFPETGISLRAIVKDNKRTEGVETVIPQDREYEIVRGAQQGIRELAPGNEFYTQGFKMEISGIDTSDWKDDAVLQQIRFCSNCDHLEQDIPPVSTTCPKCGDQSWGASSNVHAVIKLNAVKSVNQKYDARIKDGSEERESKNYRISRHLIFDSSAFAGALRMKDLHFGIEYVKQVRITELNLGQKNNFDANTIKINQQEKVPVHGFITCRYCGHSTDVTFNREAKEYHYGYCKYKTEGYKGKSDEVFQELYLQRQMQTEAIKILLPTQDFDSQSVIDMFREGLLLGIKKYYNGNPNHLELCDYREFNFLSGKMDNYLVMFDRIPGGTGYLRKLFDKEQFSELLRKAYAEIRECKCQFEGKDGCYRCIYTYGNQYKRNNLSRSKAEALFKMLLERSNDWEDLSHSLGSLPNSTRLEQSELEERFISILSKHVKEQHDLGWKWEERVVNGQVNYLFTIKLDEATYIYQVIPQFDLGKTYSLKYGGTIPDFYFKLVKANRDTEQGVETLDLDASRGIAIYLDGYSFHASKENMNFYKDVKKRLAIVESGQHISWTLTWEDLDDFEQKDTNDELRFDRTIYRSTFDKLERMPNSSVWTAENKLLSDKYGRNNMTRLLYYLALPFDTEAIWQKQCFGLAVMSQKVFGGNSFADHELSAMIVRDDLSTLRQMAGSNLGRDFWMVSDLSQQFNFTLFNIVTQLSSLQVQSYLKLIEQTEGLDKELWRKFWHIFNLYQDTFVTLPSIVQDGVADESCLDFFDEEYHPIVRQLIAHNIPFGTEGSFFMNDAEAVLGWEDKKLFMGGAEEDRKIFIQAGYTEIRPDNFDITLLL